jgi:hypothetical protein
LCDILIAICASDPLGISRLLILRFSSAKLASQHRGPHTWPQHAGRPFADGEQLAQHISSLPTSKERRGQFSASEDTALTEFLSNNVRPHTAANLRQFSLQKHLFIVTRTIWPQRAKCASLCQLCFHCGALAHVFLQHFLHQLSTAAFPRGALHPESNIFLGHVFHQLSTAAFPRGALHPKSNITRLLRYPLLT